MVVDRYRPMTRLTSVRLIHERVSSCLLDQMDQVAIQMQSTRSKLYMATFQHLPVTSTSALHNRLHILHCSPKVQTIAVKATCQNLVIQTLHRARSGGAPEDPAAAEAGGARVGGLVDEGGQGQEGDEVGEGEIVGVGQQGDPVPGALLRDVRLAGAPVPLMRPVVRRAPPRPA